MANKTFSIQIGQIECIVVNEGFREADMDWILERFTAPEVDLRPVFDDYVAEFGEFEFAMNPLVIKTPDFTILVDTGLGHTAPPFLGKLQANLSAIGIKPTDIDIVVISHADEDHIFGLTDADGNLIYPNAGYIMSSVEWEARELEGDESKLKILHKIEDKLTLIPMDGYIAPGIRALPAEGHRAGQIAVLVESEDQFLLFCADALHLPMQFERPEWTMKGDSDKAEAINTRRELMAYAYELDALVMAYHLPFPAVGHIQQVGNAYRWLPLR